MTINKRILNAKRDVDNNNETGEMVNLVKQRYNCSEADIDSNGDIWIADPMTGHWLSDDDKAELLDWIAKQ